MKLWWMQHPIRNSIVTLMLIIILVIAVWVGLAGNDAKQPTADSPETSQPLPVEHNKVPEVIEPESVSTEPSFSEGVTEITILETSPGSQHRIVHYEGARMHTEE